MTLSQAIIYYLFSFILTIVCAVLGVFIGKNLRKSKDAKTEMNSTSQK